MLIFNMLIFLASENTFMMRMMLEDLNMMRQKDRAIKKFIVIRKGVQATLKTVLQKSRLRNIGIHIPLMMMFILMAKGMGKVLKLLVKIRSLIIARRDQGQK